MQDTGSLMHKDKYEEEVRTFEQTNFEVRSVL
jgi:hypothetical protein